MKKATKNSAEEPTLGEVLAVMNERFSLVESSFNDRFDLVEERFDQRFVVLNDCTDNMDARLGDIQHKLGKTMITVEDIKDELAAALRAADDDGTAIVNHERRITHLEELSGLESVPAPHLANLGG